jgi:transcriptional regulator with XRE-family HTH domain
MKEVDVPSLVKSLRSELHLTQEQFAKEVGVTSGRISMGALARYARRNHRSPEDVFGEKRLTNGTE